MLDAAAALPSRDAGTLMAALAAWETGYPPLLDAPHNYAYGDTAVAARYVGLSQPPAPIIGEWQHGVHVRERSNHPDEIVGTDGLAHSRPSARYFVGRKDQAAALAGFGFSDVHAIGLPFAYVPMPASRPYSRSLLAMPAHGLPETGTAVVEEYAEFLAEESRRFPNIVACLHITDFRNDSVRQFFEGRNIPVVRGADPRDANAYDRMAGLFSLFEVVTSNDFGSHIPYAALCGARVSIAGPSAAFHRAHLENVPYYRNNPLMLDLQEKLIGSRALERSYPFLYVAPQEAQPCRGWAAEQIGVENRRTPSELRRLFGWTPTRIMTRRVRKTFDGAVGRVRQIMRRPQAGAAHG